MTALPEYWNSIPGWFDFQDIYSEIVKESKDKDAFVEIGTFYGKSTIFLANEIKNSGKDLPFFTVDPWNNSLIDEKGRKFPECSMDKFMANAKSCGVDRYVIPIPGLSIVAAKSFADKSLKFVFIDGEHSYEAVKSDIEAWLPKLRPGGVIAGHDYIRLWPGVKRAVNEAFGEDEIEVLRQSWRKKLS